MIHFILNNIVVIGILGAAVLIATVTGLFD